MPAHPIKLHSFERANVWSFEQLDMYAVDRCTYCDGPIFFLFVFECVLFFLRRFSFSFLIANHMKSCNGIAVCGVRVQTPKMERRKNKLFLFETAAFLLVFAHTHTHALIITIVRWLHFNFLLLARTSFHSADVGSRLLRIDSSRWRLQWSPDIANYILPPMNCENIFCSNDVVVAAVVMARHISKEMRRIDKRCAERLITIMN